MTYDIIIGIDNGVSGTIAILDCRVGTVIFKETPTISQQNYTKAKGNISRINFGELKTLFEPYAGLRVFVLIERPMVNPGRFQATISAIRSLEATLILLEGFKFAYAYLDSKEWQKALLPAGAVKEALKTCSADIGKRLYPAYSELITKHKDADGLLIAHYAKQKYNN